MSEMNVKVFEQLEEIRSSGLLGEPDLKGIAGLAEELDLKELAAEMKKITSKDQWERARGFATLLKAFEEWIKKLEAERGPVPNAGSGMNVKVFEQMEEIRSSGAINMNDLQGVKRIAEELGFKELYLACFRIASKDQWERARDYTTLMKDFGEWNLKLAEEPEDPNAGKGDETPEPEADVPGGAYAGVDEASGPAVPVVYGEHKPDVNVDPKITLDGAGEAIDVGTPEELAKLGENEPDKGAEDPKKLNEEDEE